MIKAKERQGKLLFPLMRVRFCSPIYQYGSAKTRKNVSAARAMQYRTRKPQQHKSEQRVSAPILVVLRPGLCYSNQRPSPNKCPKRRMHGMIEPLSLLTDKMSYPMPRWAVHCLKRVQRGKVSNCSMVGTQLKFTCGILISCGILRL